MKKAMKFTILFTLAAAIASAQMMGGGRGMPGRSSGTGAGTPGAGYGSMFPGMSSGETMMDAARGAKGAHGIVITPAGTVIVTRAIDSNNDGVYEPELVALTPAGTKAWSRSFSGLGFILGLSNNLLLAVEHPGTLDLTKPFASTLVAYDAATGVQRWRLELDGIPMMAEPFSGGAYVTVVSRPLLTGTPEPGMRMGVGTAVLWAIETGGNVLWKYDLSK